MNRERAGRLQKGIGVAIAAPSLAVRAGLRAALLSEAGEVEVLAELPLHAGLPDLPPETDVLLLAADDAGGEWLPRALEEALTGSEGQLALLLLTDAPELVEPFTRLPWSAWGALSLDATPEELTASLRALNEGLWVGSPALMNPLRPQTLRPQLVSMEDDENAALAEALTEREAQVLQLLARGLANKQIAAGLSISEHTVKFHVSSIYAKLGAASRTEAVRMGVQRGLVVL